MEPDGAWIIIIIIIIIIITGITGIIIIIFSEYWLMQGHQAGVIDVVLDERNNQLISLSADQTIKVSRSHSHHALSLIKAAARALSCVSSAAQRADTGRTTHALAKP